jgi:hypothetical protein
MSNPKQKRELVKALGLAITLSVPPVSMPGYFRVWATWERITTAVGATSYCRRLLLLQNHTTALRASDADGPDVYHVPFERAAT